MEAGVAGIEGIEGIGMGMDMGIFMGFFWVIWRLIYLGKIIKSLIC